MRNAYFVSGFAAAALCSALSLAAPASAQSFTTLHKFCSALPCDDGAGPLESQPIQDAAGNFFGTAQNFGTQKGGTLYELVGGTKFRKVFDFPAQVSPRGPLVQDASGNLYGIEGTGDAGGGGVFRLHPTNANKTKWTFETLYTFCPQKDSCPDGSTPIELTYEGAASGALYDGTSPLYGSTVFGGANGSGAVVRLTPKRGTWREKVIYSFCAQTDCADGQWPAYALFPDANGNLFGVTTNGGSANQGTVFKLKPNAKRTRWTQSVAYSFCPGADCADGATPSGLTLDGQGNLYGTTSSGGDANRGALFSLAPQGNGYAFTRLYSFCQQADCADGSGPLASPIVGADGTLYGTTALDSRAYSFAPQTSTYTVLHTFCTDTKCSDGIEPLSPLTPDAAGHLFGTTAFGGTKHSGGTVFVLTP
jgi:uncharacterized repeat protein (TIGR03803 family)